MTMAAYSFLHIVDIKQKRCNYERQIGIDRAYGVHPKRHQAIAALHGTVLRDAGVYQIHTHETLDSAGTGGCWCC